MNNNIYGLRVSKTETSENTADQFYFENSEVVFQCKPGVLTTVLPTAFSWK